MAYGILIGGLLLLALGCEVTMRGTVGLARQFDLPPLATGILVVAVVAVTPELFVVFRTVSMGRPEMALGGLIGSNILNILFVMGLGALIHPMASPPKVVFRDAGALFLASLVLVACALTGTVSRQAGLILLAGFVAYVVLVFVTDWRRSPEHSVPLSRALYRSEGEMPSLTAALFLTAFGIILLALGAHLGVIGAIRLARDLGWSETAIGLTVVAAGLSFPKLLVTLNAAVRGETSIAVGHLLGVGVFGLLAVLGAAALVQPLAVPQSLAGRDVFVLAGASFALLPLLAMRWRLSRPRGVLLIAAYGCYLAFLLWQQGLPLPWGL